MNEPQNISLSLISHTNVGKTTLARALLKKEDFGEVDENTHTTLESEDHDIVVTENGDRLILWDNPGFSGGLKKLSERRDQKSKSIGEKLRDIWDRITEVVFDRHTDRELYCSQQASKNMTDHADVILYLVRAKNWPKNCKYLEDEMEILDRIDKPVLVILNDTGDPVKHGDANRYVTCWETYFQNHGIPKERILPLDALTCYWTQVGLLLEKVQDLVDEKRQPSAVRLLDAWHCREKKIMEDSLATIGEFLAEAARYKLKNERSFWEGVFSFKSNPAIKELEEWIKAGCTEVVDNLLKLAMIDGNQIPPEFKESISESRDFWFPLSLFFGNRHFYLKEAALTKYTRFIFAFYLQASHFTRGQEGDWPKKKVNSEAELRENWMWYEKVTLFLEPRENELNGLWDRLRKSNKTTSKDLSALYQPLLDLLAKQYPDSKHFLPPPGDIPTSPEEDAECEPDEESE